MKFFYLLIFIFLTEKGFTQKKYYVSSSGNDHNNGTINSPFLTLPRSLENVSSGDTIFIRGGKYLLSDRILISIKGNSARPVVISAYPNEKPVFDATGFNQNPENTKNNRFHRNGAIHIEDASWIVLSGIKVINSHATGIMVNGKNTKNIVLSGCITEGSYSSGIVC